jgi:hypothetical protein
MNGRKVALIFCLAVFAIFFSSGSAQCGCGPFACPNLRAEKPTKGIAEPKIIYFTASKQVIKPGDPVTLGWSTENADSAWIDAPGTGSIALETELGELGLHPTVTTTYTLYAKSDDPDVRTPVVSKSLTISVEQTQIKIPQTQGTVTPGGTPHPGGCENCP